MKTFNIYIVYTMLTDEEGNPSEPIEYVYDDQVPAIKKQQEIIKLLEIHQRDKSMVVKHHNHEMFYAVSRNTLETTQVRLLHREIIEN
jgi:hypothetical protein